VAAWEAHNESLNMDEGFVDSIRRREEGSGSISHGQMKSMPLKGSSTRRRARVEASKYTACSHIHEHNSLSRHHVRNQQSLTPEYDPYLKDLITVWVWT
jgi:hypothetical protein